MGNATVADHRLRGAPLIAAAIVAVVCLLALACSSSSSGSGTSNAVPDNATADEGTPQDGGSVVIGVPADTNGWNPTRDQWSGVGVFVGSSVLEPLLALDAEGQPQPLLVTSWEPNANLDSWTLHLRENVRFQDGEPFDASAVKMNIDGIDTAPLSGVALKGLFKGTTIIDDHTLQVDLTQPWGAFPSSFMAGQSASMMAPAMLNAPDHGESHPIGTGPFTFVSWSPDDSFVVQKNPDYWQPGKPHLDHMEFKVIGDEASLAASLQSGDTNMVLLDEPASADQLASSYHVIKDWQLDPSMVMTNTLATVGGAPNPLSNPHARMALAYATDRTAVAASVGSGVLIPSGPFPSNSPWGVPDDQSGYPQYDQQKARDEVAAYKADTGAETLHFTLAGPSGNAASVLELLQSQWKEVGIDVDLQTVEASSFITQVVGGHYEAALFGIYTAPDPDQYHYFWSADTAKGEGNISINFTEFTTPQLEEDLAKGRQSSSFDERRDAYVDAARQINAAAVNIWLFYTPHSLVADKDLKGLAPAGTLHFASFQPKTWWPDVWQAS